MNQVSDTQNTQVEDQKQPENAPKEEEFVSRKAYIEVSQDMHKYKEQLKETKAQLNEFMTQQEAEKEQKLKEQERFKELFEKKEKELEEYRAQVEQNKSSLIKQQKLNAVLAEVGKLEKPEFSQFIPLDSVKINEDGSIDPASVKEVAESFRQEFGMCVKKTSNPPLPSNAPTTGTGSPKNLNEMSMDELKNLYSKIRKK